MADNIYQRLGLTAVINAAGKMTALGGSAQADNVAEAQAAAAQWHVDLQALRDRAGERIAQFTGAEAGCVTTGAAAGIAVSVAACITGTRLDRVLRLPDSSGLTNRVLLQAGHDVHFGASVAQMIRLGGGVPVIFGWANLVPHELLESALASGTGNVASGNVASGNVASGNEASGNVASGNAALVYVQSHHSVQEQMISLPDCIQACHRWNVPVIVDAAAEEDLQRYIAAGADLVTYSGGKAIGGPTVGFICGRRDLIDACELQTRGIARAMKVGKEQIVGLLVALQAYAARDIAQETARRSQLVGNLLGGLANIHGLRAFMQPDEAGRGINRVALAPTGHNGAELRDLVRYLAAGSPSIRTRNHHIDDGFVLIDPREITAAHVPVIAARIAAFFAQAERAGLAKSSAAQGPP